MKKINKTAAKTLTAMLEGMGPGELRHIGEKGGTYMQVSVEYLDEKTVSVAHYFEQNGDLCPDPDMSFMKAGDDYYPIDCTQATGYYTRAIIEFGEDGEAKSFSPRAQKELCSFAGMWFRNIKDQQSDWFKAMKAPRKVGKKTKFQEAAATLGMPDPKGK